MIHSNRKRDLVAYAVLFGIALTLLAVLFFKLFTTLPVGLAGVLSLAHLAVAGSFGLLLGLLLKRLSRRFGQADGAKG